MDPPPLHVLSGLTPPISPNMTANSLATPATAVQINYADSMESSPRSRPGDSNDHHLEREILPPVPGAKLRLMCSFGGHIMPRPHDKSLVYVGGETRLVVIDQHSSFSSFCSRLSRTLLNGRPFTLKYQLPNEDLDSLVSITTDEDFENMVEEYDRLSESSTSSLSSSRIRLFLFVSKLETAATMGSLLDDAKSETWFVDALNGTGLLPRGHSDSATRNCLLNLDDSDLEAQVEEESKQQAKIRNEEVQQTMPDSPMVEKSSSFGSSSSSPSMSNLPPIRVRAEEQKVGIEEQFAQLSFPANMQKQEDGYGLVSTAPPPMADASINHPGINRVLSADEISDQGEPGGFRRPPLPLQPKASCTSYNLPSPDSVASDSSIASTNSFSKPVYYQDQQANHVALRETARATTNINPEHSVPNSAIQIQQVQDSGYILPPPQLNPQQQNQQQQQPPQQFVHPSVHYILDPASAQVPMASYYPVYAPSVQQQQQFHHHPADQNYPVYVMPVAQAQTYTAIQSNIAETSVVGSSRPLTPPNHNIVASSAAYRDGIPPIYPAKPATTPKPEIPSSVYKTTLTTAPQMVQVPSSQFHSQYVGFHPSQSIAVAPAASGANFGYEFPSAAQDQLYYNQHQVAPLPSQYQTMTPAAAVAALANASKQLPTVLSPPAVMAATFIFSLPPNPTNLPSDPSSSSSLLPFSAYRYGYIYRVKPVSAFHFRAPKITCCLSIKQTNDNSATIQNDSLDGIRVIFAAGGTGGHIYPAVAVADELKSSNSTSKILFVGLPNSMESAAIPSAGYDFTAIPAVRLARPFISPVNLLLPFHLIKATRQCCQVLRDFKPHIVVGTGGYASFSACLAAVLSGIKVVIQEQNSVPGIANWVLSLFADVIFVAFNSTVDCFPRKSKCMVVGNPVRQSLKGYVSKAVARTHFFPRSGKLAGDSEARVILVLGGSLGANAINIALLNLYSQMLAEHKNWFIIWQTGVHSFDEMDSLVRNHKRVLLTPFLHNMDLAYAAADLIVSRAGALTCYEILSAGKPSILIPSPNVAEGHQFKNASLLADVAGSKLITEDELDSITLNSAIEEILGDENLMAEMSERALKAAKCEAAATIANHIISMIEVLLRAS